MLELIIAAAFGWGEAAIPLLAEGGRRWVVVGQAHHTRSSVDEASIRRRDTLARFTIRNDWLRPQRDGASGMVAEVETDCSARTMAMLSFVKFDPARQTLAAGVIPSQDRQAGPVGDGTLPGAMLDFACRKPR